MAAGEDVMKALFGDEESEIVKSGALAITRLTGWVAGAGVVLTSTEVFGKASLSPAHRLWGSIAIVAVFAFIASADALARAFVTAHSQPEVRALARPLQVRIPERDGDDEKGWNALLMRFNPQKPDSFDYWVVKEQEALWITEEKVRPA